MSPKLRVVLKNVPRGPLGAPYRQSLQGYTADRSLPQLLGLPSAGAELRPPTWHKIEKNLYSLFATRYRSKLVSPS
jgi:hypothetical protein